MAHIASFVLFAIAACGTTLLLVQLGSVARHRRQRRVTPRSRPGISILKPLCGHDDDLAAHLEGFATLDYPDYELLLGVRNRRDAAWPIAVAAAARFPERVRVVLQRGAPGGNPKVNQLITLAAAARHDLLVVSDSNVRVGSDYLDEIAACFDDPSVGLVTHAVAGVGAERIGSLLDNLHLSGSVGPGMIAAKRVAGKDIVVGKSMALRRGDLDALGGFEAVRDHLAEDYVLGKRIASLGKSVAVARAPVFNVSRRRSVGDFYRRYQRWSVIHRQAVGRLIYAGELVMNPIALAAVALALDPTLRSLALAAAFTSLRLATDGAGTLLLCGSLRARDLLATPIKDALLVAAWWHGFTHRHVEWRGNRLEVLPGTLLETIPANDPDIAYDPASCPSPSDA